MLTIWFLIVAFMLVVYVILDGFDIGAGAVHYLVGKNPEEREAVITSIGPIWDGNEVWLLSTGGVLYFAFPVLYSASFSGFYLPLMMVLWLLIVRATGIELRHQLKNPLWEQFWDFAFSASSILLAIFFGAALGNVIRGVPLNEEGYFFLPLWTDFMVSENPGILDWFTILAGVVSLVALSVHGAAYLAVKTEDEMLKRARKIVSYGWFVLLAITIVSLIAVVNVREGILDNYLNNYAGFLIPVAVIASLGAVKYFNSIGQDKYAFWGTSAYLACMLGGAVYSVFPDVLPATDPARSLNIENASAGSYGLQVGLIWWTIGITIAIGYFVFLFRTFKGKVKVGEGH